MNEGVVATIKMCLSMNVASFVVNKTIAIELMKALTNRYEKPCVNKNFFNMQVGDDVFRLISI